MLIVSTLLLTRHHIPKDFYCYGAISPYSQSCLFQVEFRSLAVCLEQEESGLLVASMGKEGVVPLHLSTESLKLHSGLYSIPTIHRTDDLSIETTLPVFLSPILYIK